MPFTMLGSFPNSQVRPRPVTEDETIQNVNVPADTVTTIAASNVNRTSLLILNEGGGNIRLATAGEPDPSSTSGFLLVNGASVEFESQEEIKGYASGASTVLSVQIGVG